MPSRTLNINGGQTAPSAARGLPGRILGCPLVPALVLEHAPHTATSRESRFVKPTNRRFDCVMRPLAADNASADVMVVSVFLPEKPEGSH
ncbi:hypothetical protein FDECE_2423, partial [Fusarium decemcellulare]